MEDAYEYRKNIILAKNEDERLDNMKGEIGSSHELRDLKRLIYNREKKGFITFKRKIVNEKSDFGHYGAGPGSYPWER